MGIAAAPAADRQERIEPLDVELVDAARRGDDRAFERLYARYQRRIAAYVYGMVSDHGRAEDITQEVFISALRRMRETDRPIAFRPWIYEIAKNACIDQFRRSRRTEEVSYDAAGSLGAADHGRLVATDAAPDQAVVAKQQLSDLCGAFGGLSDSHHRILVLRELEGLSYREIGERMGLSRPSVESTLFRARRRLSEEYDELATGRRCQGIQSLMERSHPPAPSLHALGERDRRRLARHLSHCKGCRRHARALGVDRQLMPEAAGHAVIERVAGVLPLPVLERLRRSGGSESAGASVAPQAHATAAQWSAGLSSLTEPLLTGGGRGAAVVAALATGALGGALGHEPVRVPDRPAPPARSDVPHVVVDHAPSGAVPTLIAAVRHAAPPAGNRPGDRSSRTSGVRPGARTATDVRGSDSAAIGQSDGSALTPSVPEPAAPEASSARPTTTPKPIDTARKPTGTTTSGSRPAHPGRVRVDAVPGVHTTLSNTRELARTLGGERTARVVDDLRRILGD